MMAFKKLMLINYLLAISACRLCAFVASSNARPGTNNIIQQQQQQLVASNPSNQIPTQASNGIFVPNGNSNFNQMLASNQHATPQQQAASASGPAPRLDGPASPPVAAAAAAATAANPQAAPQAIAASLADNLLVGKAQPAILANPPSNAPGSLAAQPAASSSSSSASGNLNAGNQQQQQNLQPKYAANMELDCMASGGFISFELITGYVLSAPAELMLMQPGTIQLTECLNICRQNSSCLAINFETGLCVLLQDSADRNPQALQKSQFPVFTIYAHKICLQGDRANRCHKSWSFERVIGWVLNNMEKKTLLTKTRLECLQACYNEPSFQCKSFNYDLASGSCQLSDVDRHSLPNMAARRRHFVESSVDTIDYGENNCVQEVRGICDFKPLQNRILKTVDSIHQETKTEPECRKKCLQAPYRCHSYDLGDLSNPVCRTSHLDRNSLQQIQDPHLEIQGAISYELDSCYNVTVSCKSREMVARVRTNKLFNGKIYAKNAPLSCMQDVSSSMDFELSMAFQDACSIIKNPQTGLFTNEIVIQHNDMVVTNADIGLNLKCHYDLRNQTVFNNINLDDFISRRDPIDIASQSATVKSPNISMQILKHDGNFIQQAQVGDPLMLRFAITDERSPFEIFVRDLYAMDGIGGTEVMLIDGEGCPTDPSIMAAMTNSKGNGQTLEAQFDAFKFPTSETVAFRALVTPCIPHCEPVHCQNRAFDGVLFEAESFGKRKRRRRRSVSPMNNYETSALLRKSHRRQRELTASSATEEVVLRNSIAIKDRFFEGDSSDPVGGDKAAYELMRIEDNHDQNNNNHSLMNQQAHSTWITNSSLKFGSLAFLFCALLVAQSATLVGWIVMTKRSQGTSKLILSSAANQLVR